MLWQRIFIFILLLDISYKAFAIDNSIRQKYPNVLLTDDYGILNENDLASYTWSVKPAPFSIKEGLEYNYWQCFPRDHISITLEDKGYSASEIGGDENYGDLMIRVWLDNGISHRYYMRRAWPVSGYGDMFSDWQKFMKNEKYVCLAGRFSSYKETKRNGKTWKKYSWVYEKLKTKKGCDSFFAGQCNYTHKQFLRDHTPYKPLKNSSRDWFDKLSK